MNQLIKSISNSQDYPIIIKYRYFSTEEKKVPEVLKIIVSNV